MNAPLTPAQTVGPFFHDGLLRGDLRSDAEADCIRIRGFVYDGDGIGVPDAMLEFWRGDTFARVGTGADGAFMVRTPRPQPVHLGDSLTHAPHVSVAVFARGLLNHLVTRVYFPEEPSNVADPILLRVPADRRATLIARRDAPEGAESVYSFDVVLQGSGETVFFDYR